jgi:hypothetical protein
VTTIFYIDITFLSGHTDERSQLARPDGDPYRAVASGVSVVGTTCADLDSEPAAEPLRAPTHDRQGAD